MKRKAITLMVILMTGTALLSQTKKNAIKTDLISPFLGTGVLKYERVLSEYSSVQMGVFYAWDYPAYDSDDHSASGFAVTPEFRYYVLKKKPAPAGTYLAPNFRYQRLQTENLEINTEATLLTYSIAFNVGYQLVLKDIFLIDAWVGPSFVIRKVVDESVPGAHIGYQTDNGFGARIGVSIGLIF